jgi:hypothetical protein
MKEYILCAANYYDDGNKHNHQPVNIDSGFVVCGMRHHNCITTFSMIVGFPYDENGMNIRRTEKQGFLTNANRFVEREEAAQIAFECGQIKQHTISLYSEDLY